MPLFNLKKFREDHPDPLAGLQLDDDHSIINSDGDERILQLDKRARTDSTFDLGVMLTAPVLKPEIPNEGLSSFTLPRNMSRPNLIVRLRGPSGEKIKLTFKLINLRVAKENDYISQGSVIEFLEQDGFDEKYINRPIIENDKQIKFENSNRTFWGLYVKRGLDPSGHSIKNESEMVYFYRSQIFEPIAPVLRSKYNSQNYKVYTLIRYLKQMLFISDENSTLGSDVEVMAELLNQMQKSQPSQHRVLTRSKTQKLEELRKMLQKSSETLIKTELSTEVFFPSMLLSSRFDIAFHYNYKNPRTTDELKKSNNLIYAILPEIKNRELEFSPIVLVEAKKRSTGIMTVHQEVQKHFQKNDYFWLRLSKLVPGSDSTDTKDLEEQRVDAFFDHNHGALLNYKNALNKLIQQALWLGVSKAILTDYENSIFIHINDFDEELGNPHICLSFIHNLVDSMCRLRTLCFLNPIDDDEADTVDNDFKATWYDKFIRYEKMKNREVEAAAGNHDDDCQNSDEENQDQGGDEKGPRPSTGKRRSSQHKVSTFTKRSKSGKEKEAEASASESTQAGKVKTNKYPITPSSSSSEESDSSYHEIPKIGTFVEKVFFSDEFPFFERKNIHIPLIDGDSDRNSMVFSSHKSKFNKFLNVNEKDNTINGHIVTCTLKLVAPLLSSKNREFMSQDDIGNSDTEITEATGRNPKTEDEWVKAIEKTRSKVFQDSIDEIEHEISIYRTIRDAICKNKNCKRNPKLKEEYEGYFLINDILNYGFMVDTSISFGPLSCLSSPGPAAFILFQDNHPKGTEKITDLTNETLSPEQKEEIVKMYKVLHDCHILHNDIRRGNILMFKDHRGSSLGFKIIDFGLSTVKQSSMSDEDWKLLTEREERWVYEKL